MPRWFTFSISIFSVLLVATPGTPFVELLKGSVSFSPPISCLKSGNADKQPPLLSSKDVLRSSQKAGIFLLTPIMSAMA
jgi:hypothetical protein